MIGITKIDWNIYLRCLPFITSSRSSTGCQVQFLFRVSVLQFTVAVKTLVKLVLPILAIIWYYLLSIILVLKVCWLMMVKINFCSYRWNKTIEPLSLGGTISFIPAPPSNRNWPKHIHNFSVPLVLAKFMVLKIIIAAQMLGWGEARACFTPPHPV